MSKLAIEAKGVTKAYPLSKGGERLALIDLDLSVEHGDFVCLLGPSGCGKTTLLNILSGLDQANAGAVHLYAPDPGRPPVVGYMFQESRLLPWLTVAENIAFVLDRDGRSKQQQRDEVLYWLGRVGLEGRHNDYPRQLSIGQQQRVAVARALIIRPDILFMDEPFSALDELTASMMRQELLELWGESKATVVFVTHNPLEATYLADRMVVMTGSPGEITSDLNVRELLPRPRDAHADAVWKVSRRAVAALSSPSPEAV
jgi:ABC-type nitrate/sulfonate/bicarbonate transport system ATPase subunit